MTDGPLIPEAPVWQCPIRAPRPNGERSIRLLGCDRANNVLAVAGRHGVLGYAPYGHRSGGSPATLGYMGQMHEDGTGWQFLGNGYRIYNPVLMRFHSPDSLSPFGRGGTNAYAYSAGDPVNYADPSGHFALPVFRPLFGIFRVLGRSAASMAIAASRVGQRIQRIRTVGLSGRGSLDAARQMALPGPARRIDATHGAQATINDLPNETIQRIAGHLPEDALRAFAQTSRRMAGIAGVENGYRARYHNMPGRQLRNLLENPATSAQERQRIQLVSSGNWQRFMGEVGTPGWTVTANRAHNFIEIADGRATGVLPGEIRRRPGLYDLVAGQADRIRAVRNAPWWDIRSWWVRREYARSWNAPGWYFDSEAGRWIRGTYSD